MTYRGYMRRGVSLEVIVEEDDNAEVSLDPIIFHDESDSSPSSPTLSEENEIRKLSKDGCDQNFNDIDDSVDRLRHEKEKRRKQKEEKERWRNLARQRSLSCETLTILDVGDDEFSREQWEVETRDWDSENPNTSSEIEQNISRRKILASRLEYQDKYEPDYDHAGSRNKYDPDYPDETRVDDEVDEVGMENGTCWNPDKDTEGIERDSTIRSRCSQMEAIQGDKDETNGLKEDEEETEEDKFSDDEKQGENDSLEGDIGSVEDCDIEINQNYNTFKGNCNNGSAIDAPPSKLPAASWSQDPFSNGEDSWITVGELEDGNEEESENANHNDDNILTQDSTPSSITIISLNNNNTDLDNIENSPKTKHKEVRFSDQLEFVNESKKEITMPRKINTGNNKNENAINDITETLKTMPTNDINQEEHTDKLVSVRAGKHLFESKLTGRTSSPLAERLTAVLETPDIMIIEKTDYSRDEEVSLTEQSPDQEVPQGTTSPTYNVHNTELHPEELPPPHTVASVRRLFEKLPIFTFRNVSQFNLPSRYDHVRSNPTSKILRFDRHEQNTFTPIEKPPPPPQPQTSSPPPVSNAIKYTPEMLQNAHKKNIITRPPEDFSSTGVHLRKPQLAHGFDVRKALRENPRYFHIRVGEKGKKEEKRAINSSHNTPLKVKKSTVTYSYLEAKHQRHSGNTTSLRWTKESVDRSDSESMCSESSEDSGVSRDFTSSILTSFTSSSKRKKPKWKDQLHLQEEYGSDPSFKWIDPTILAKIRARGTTVIYFGPRHRPQETLQNRNHRRNFQNNLPLFEDIPQESTTQTGIASDFENNNAGHLRTEAQYNRNEFAHPYIHTQTPTNNENARPKIVGVTHKKIPKFICEKDLNPLKESSDTKHQSKPKPFLHMDSRILHRKDVKKKFAEGNSIIYDFTEKQT